MKRLYCISQTWPFVLTASIVALCHTIVAGPAFAATKGASVQKQEMVGNKIHVVLALEAPIQEPVAAKDGNMYSRLALRRCGKDNVFGRPALPIVSHTLELPQGVDVSVVAEEKDMRELVVKHPVYPHQPPVPKQDSRSRARPFLLDTDYYHKEKSVVFQKSKEGRLEVKRFTRRGRNYVNIVARPFACNIKEKRVRYPAELHFHVTCLPGKLPKSAGPRTGVITVVDVSVDSRADVAALARAGYNIGRARSGVVTVYASADEITALREAGYSIKETGQQQMSPRERQSVTTPDKALGSYHSYATLTTELETHAAAYPGICKLYSIGQSVQGRELWAMKISDNPGAQEDEPEVKYVSTMHGDEPVGTEMCLYLIDLLLTNYPANTRVSNLVDSTEIWIVPLMNPDGLEAGTRFNAGGYDLNRSFPEGTSNSLGNVMHGPAPVTAGRPLEVVRVMEWTATNSFVLSANFHGGALVVNYPYDNDGLGNVNSPTPDDALLEAVAGIYASNNAPMLASSYFSDGIVNGAVWYVVDGGMQDWHYRYLGCNDMTIELSDVKTPSEGQLAQLAADNRESMLAFLESVHVGVRGIVTDSTSGGPIRAAINVVGIRHNVFSDPDVGDYHRMLLPGVYDVMVSAPGYTTRTITNVVVGAGQAARVDVALEHNSGREGTVILVSHDSTRTGALAYKAQKETEGFTVYEVVMSGTHLNPENVRHDIREVYNATMADYVVILGDINQVPTFYSRAGYASDLPYGLLDPGEAFADYLGKDVIVARISLESNTGIASYTAKLQAFTANSRSKKNLDLTWISHGYSSSEYDIGEETHDWVIANCIPTEYKNEKLYRNIGSASELTSHVNAGTDAIVYSGHGGTYTWVRYDYDVSALSSLNNNLDAPIVIGHCCSSGEFGVDTCFGEAWLETAGRGIVYVGGSASTYWDPDDVMERAEFSAMVAADGVTIGQAIEAGLLEVHNQFPGTEAGESEYYYTIYQVFGDPTVALFGLPGFQITTAPSLPITYSGESCSIPLNVAGGLPTYDWTLSGSVLPGGLALDTVTGVISGIPTNSGTFVFTVEVTDSSASPQSATRELTLSVVDRLVITSQGDLPQGANGSSYSATILCDGGTTPYTWSVGGTNQYEESDPGTGWLGTGTSQGWHGDDQTWQYDLPWAFPFYGADGQKNSYTSLWICSNGFIDFGAESTAYANSDSLLLANVRIAPLWDDLVVYDVFIAETAEYVVIRWDGRTYASESLVGIEAVLYRSGDIKFNYSTKIKGITPSIGVSGGDGERYTLSSYNGDQWIPENVSTLFSYGSLLPPGLMLDENSGLISGSLAATGTYCFLISAQDAGVPQQSVTTNFSIEIVELPALFVTVPVDAAEGDGVLIDQGSVSIAVAIGTDLVVGLLSGDTTEISVTNVVVITAGETNAAFSITVVDDSDLDGTQAPTVTAAAAGYLGAITTIDVHDDETASLALDVPGSVAEGDGTLVGQGTVMVSAVTDADVTVTLGSDDESELTVPASVIIGSGQTSAVFSVTVVDDGVIDGTQPALVVASIENWGQASNVIDVADNEDRHLVLSIPVQAGEGDGLLTNAGLVSISGTLSTDLTVLLQSSDAGEISVENEISIPAGHTSATFDLSVVDDTDEDGAQIVTVTATASGFTVATNIITIQDNDALASWTIMVYMAADNNLEGAGIDDFLEMSKIGSSAAINIVVLVDRIRGYDSRYGDWSGSRRGRIGQGDVPDTSWGKDLGELNMGAPETFKAFLDWAAGSFPAERYALVFWNHGDGWSKSGQRSVKAVCGDDTDDGDYLYMDEVQNSLADAGLALDLVGFDACLMGMLEVAYEIRAYGNVMVASEETEPGDGWPYDVVLNQLAADPDMSAVDLATIIVDEYHTSYGNGETLSAVDLAQIDAVAGAVGNLAAALVSSWDADDETIIAAAAAVTAAVDVAVIREQHGSEWPGSHGLALYFPAKPSQYDAGYQTTIDFGIASGWPEFLTAYYGEMMESWVGGVRMAVQSYAEESHCDLYDLCARIVDRMRILTQSNLPAALVSEPYSIAIEAGGGAAPYTWAVVTGDAYAETDVGSGWVDGGTAQEWRADDACWSYVLPWAFPYYGGNGGKGTCTSLWISSNGFIDFGGESSDYSNSDAELISNSRIAPLWDDLQTDGADEDIYIAVSNDYVAIRWVGSTYSASAPVDFQVVLYTNGNVRFNYAAQHTLLTPTIGLSYGDGTHYLLSSRNGVSSIRAGVSSLLTYEDAAGLPPGLSLDVGTGLITGSPTQPGTFMFTVRLAGQGASARITERSFILSVLATPLLNVVMPACVAEGDGTLTNLCSVGITPAVSSNVNVVLVSGDLSEATVPVSVEITAGNTNAPFDLVVLDDGDIDGCQPVTVTASVEGWTNAVATVNVIDDDDSRRPVLRWDIVAGASWYQLWILRGDDVYSRQWLDIFYPVWAPGVDLRGGDYSWWVRGWGAGIGYSDWSSNKTFSIPVVVPSNTVALAPAGIVTTNKPVFAWTEAEHASWYYLWVNRNGVRHLMRWVEETTNFTPETALPLGIYRWWIRPWNYDGYADWASAVDFTYGRSMPLSPTGTVTGTRQPQFVWSNVEDAMWYRLHLNKNGLPHAKKWVQSNSWAFAEYLAAGDYEWWVGTWNEDGDGPWSDAANFTIPHAVPDPATWLSPTGTVGTGEVSYTWASDSAATWYQLWVARNDELFHALWYSVGSVTGQVSRSVPAHQAGSYSWWVRGWGPDGLGKWSDRARFSVE